MKTALITMIEIKINKKCSGALRCIIERVIVKTTGSINNGVKFLSAFRRLIIPKISNGIITIAKKNNAIFYPKIQHTITSYF